MLTFCSTSILVGQLIIFLPISFILQDPTLAGEVNQLSNSTVGALEDDKFIQKYGNENVTSGFWEPIRNILGEDEKLKNICYQAHELYSKEKLKLARFGFFIRQLQFPDSPQYQPMEIDEMVYSSEEDPEFLFHFTKGLESHCVYYLLPLDEELLKLRLKEHVCGIKFPFDNNNSILNNSS